MALRPDRGNLTAAFEWAAASGRWTLAATLVIGGYPAYIFDGAALEAHRLIQRALDADTGHNTELTDQLHAALIMTTAWLTDWATYTAAGQQLTRSTSGIMRAIGFVCLGVHTPFGDTSRVDIDRARQELAAARTVSTDELHDITAGLIHWVEGRVAAGRGDFEAGLEGSTAFLATCRTIDFYPTPVPRAVKHGAVCQILLGDPIAAIDTATWLIDFDRSTFNIDDIRALALLAQGRLSEAMPVIHAHATRGLTGRMPGHFCDSALLLAALSHAEGDDDRARDLLRDMGAGLEPGIIL